MEYIEREKLLDAYDGIWDCCDLIFEPEDRCCHAGDCDHCKWRETKNALRKIAANIPAADVRPVVQGRWEVSYADYIVSGKRPYFRYCSECGETTARLYNYCPNCGAKTMKKRRHDVVYDVAVVRAQCEKGDDGGWRS